MKQIKVFCENDGKYYEIEEGSSISVIADKSGIRDIEFPVIAALEDNKLKELSTRIFYPCKIRLIDRTHPDGRRTYMRSLGFVIQKAVSNLFPDAVLTYEYSLPSGLYAELHNKDRSGIIPVDNAMVEQISSETYRLVRADIPFEKLKTDADTACGIFSGNSQHEKSELIRSTGRFATSVYRFDDRFDTFYGPLAPSSSYIDIYDLYPYGNGFCIRWPSIREPHRLTTFKLQDKLFSTLKEYSDWCSLMNVSGVGTLNNMILSSKAKDLINISESLHERKYARIADKIYSMRDKVRIVAIAGPSSSGKTTTSKRIALQCKVLGLNPVVIELDNYFVNRENTPLDSNGDYDFESLGAMDLYQLNKDLNALMDGKEVEIPVFDFTEGRRTYNGNVLRMSDDDILIIEGIHALNPAMLSEIDGSRIFRVYASALTSLSLDENNNISTSDNRLLRRIIRDNRTRGVGPEGTILRWPSVRKGEMSNIFPFQENADIMFNSALIYELPMLKYYAEPLLRRIEPKSPAYTEAVRLLKFLDYIVPLSPEEIRLIPPTSVMREFIGGGSLVG